MKTPTNLLVAISLLVSATAFGQNIEDLLGEAQRAYVRGDSAGAKEKFQLVRRLEPNNITAINYLRRIMAEEKLDAGSKPGPNATQAALQQLIIPKIDVREASLAEVLEFLRQKGTQLSNNKVAINFVMQLDEQAKGTKITLALQNVPFTEAVRYIGELANVQFSYERFAIVVKPKGAVTEAPGDTQPTKKGVRVEGLN